MGDEASFDVVQQPSERHVKRRVNAPLSFAEPKCVRLRADSPESPQQCGTDAEAFSPFRTSSVNSDSRLSKESEPIMCLARARHPAALFFHCHTNLAVKHVFHSHSQIVGNKG